MVKHNNILENKKLMEQLTMALDQIQYLQEQRFNIQRQMYGRKKEDIPFLWMDRPICLIKSLLMNQSTLDKKARK